MITKPEGTAEYLATSGGGVDMEELQVQDRHNNCMSAQRAREVFLINTELLRKQTFHERLHYEIGFFLSWHHFPARSLVYSSTYNFQMKNLVRHLDGKQIIPLSLSKLKGPTLTDFTKNVLFSKEDLPQITKVFSHADISIDEAKPDFMAKKYQFLRQYFRFDLDQLCTTMRSKNINEKYIDTTDLYKFI